VTGTRKGGEGRIGEALERPEGAAPPFGDEQGARREATPRNPRRARGLARGAVLLLLAMAAFFSASAFLDAGPRKWDGGRGGAEAPQSGSVPPGMRCGAGNLCEKGSSVSSSGGDFRYQVRP
jgi:hypothetical protein